MATFLWVHTRVLGMERKAGSEVLINVDYITEVSPSNDGLGAYISVAGGEGSFETFEPFDQIAAVLDKTPRPGVL